MSSPERPSHPPSIEYRVGIGFDMHALAEGRRLILGGVAIDHPLGLAGHSDADVLAHAIMDALLGAAGRGDIGHWFPPDDPRYAGADSLELARQVCQVLAADGWQIANVDATIIAQRPRLAPHVEAMRANLAAALAIPSAAIGVKATTPEHLGALGREEGIAGQAVALLWRQRAQDSV